MASQGPVDAAQPILDLVLSPALSSPAAATPLDLN